MASRTVSAPIESIRRLAVTNQCLSGFRRAKADDEAILAAVKKTCYIQWDPISVIAPSHVIALWARLGSFRLSSLEKLMWKEKKLFLHWTPIATVVLTEDYPLYYSLMKRYPESLTRSWGSQAARAKKFLVEHKSLRKSILSELKNGPMQLTQFQHYVRSKRSEDGWSSGSDVSTMLYHLHMSGEVMVVGHEGNQNVWGLSEEFLPGWTERRTLPQDEVEREAALRTIGAMGAASPSEIYRYFIRGRFKNLKGAIQSLLDDSMIHRIDIPGQRSRDGFFIRDQDVALLQEMETDTWQPRMTLLAPFDNMVAVRDWTKRVFAFGYVHEQFLPREKRRYGTFVLPILWGDRIIGRVDPRMDADSGKFVVNTVHAEPGAPDSKEVATEIADTIRLFSEFLGADEVLYSSMVPHAWKSVLR